MHSRRKRVALWAAASVLCTGLGSEWAAAEWIYSKEEKAFGETQSMAMSIGDASIAFVTCNDKGLTVSLATPEDWSDSSASMNLLGPSLLISIDGQKPDNYEIGLNENTAHKIIGATQDNDVARQAADKMAAARKRIDIGLQLGGERFHASRLSAAGATRKIQAVLDACAEQKKPDVDQEQKAPGKD